MTLNYDLDLQTLQQRIGAKQNVKRHLIQISLSQHTDTQTRAIALRGLVKWSVVKDTKM